MEILKDFYIFVRVGVVLYLLNQPNTFGLSQIPTLIKRIFNRLKQIKIILVKLEGVLLEFGQIK